MNTEINQLVIDSISHMKPTEFMHEYRMARLASITYMSRSSMETALNLMFDSWWIIDPTEDDLALVGVKGKNQYIAFRGTDHALDILTDADVRKREHEVFGAVHAGFLAEYERISARVDNLIDGTMNLYVSGHSLGGALALMYSVNLLRSHQNPSIGRSYGAPKVGGHAFTAVIEAMFEVYQEWDFVRYVNNQDAVARMPRANWIKIAKMLLTKTPDLDNELIYYHPEIIPAVWFDGEHRLRPAKPFSLNPLGKISDHSMDKYMKKIELLQTDVTANYLRMP
jgi:hypothetical protein